MRSFTLFISMIVLTTTTQGQPHETSTANFVSAGRIETAFETQLLGITDEHRKTLDAGQKTGLIELAPVHLPTDPPGDCNHYGWPVATMSGDTIVVMHRRIPGHRAKGAGEPHPKMSYGVVLRSDDGGKTWSEPYDLRDCMKPEDRNRGGIVPLSHRAKFDKGNKSPLGYKVHLHAIGTAREDAAIAVNNHGVFRSEDAGRTWKHFPEALREIELSCLKVGHAGVLHMLGELFVEYQLNAQKLRPDLFVAMAAYGDYSAGYIGTEIAYSRGGYEMAPGRPKTSPQADGILMGAVKKMLERLDWLKLTVHFLPVLLCTLLTHGLSAA